MWSLMHFLQFVTLCNYEMTSVQYLSACSFNLFVFACIWHLFFNNNNVTILSCILLASSGLLVGKIEYNGLAVITMYIPIAGY